MFHVWFSIKSREMKLGAETSCIFSLKFFRKCVPWSFKPSLHRKNVAPLGFCTSVSVIHFLWSYSFLSTVIFWQPTGYFFPQQTPPQCTWKYLQYPTHKISDLLYFLTDKTGHPQLEAKDVAKGKLSLGTLHPMPFKSKKWKKSLSLHALTLD